MLLLIYDERASAVLSYTVYEILGNTGVPAHLFQFPECIHSLLVPLKYCGIAENHYKRIDVIKNQPLAFLQ